MPFKDPEKRRLYQRDYKRRQRAKRKENLSIPCQTPQEPQVPRSLNWTKPYKRLGDYYLQGGWLFDSYSGRPVKMFRGPI